MAKKEVQTLDYTLVLMQTIFDLIFTGLLGMTDYVLDLWTVFIYFCFYSGFTLDSEYALYNLQDII